MKFEKCVIHIVVRDGETMIRIAEYLNSDDELLWGVEREPGSLIHKAMRDRLLSGPIVCNSLAEVGTFFQTVVDFHSSRGDGNVRDLVARLVVRDVFALVIDSANHTPVFKEVSRHHMMNMHPKGPASQRNPSKGRKRW